MSEPLRTPPPSVEVEHRADGAILLRSPLPLPRVRQSLPHIFDETADAHPDRLFMRQRTVPGGPWREITYRDAQRAANGLAQWLIDQGLKPGDCVAYLSAPSIEHADPLLMACDPSHAKPESCATGISSMPRQACRIVRWRTVRCRTLRCRTLGM